MSSRERVRCAINFQEADRVPLDVGGSKVTGVCADAHVKLVEYLKLNPAPPKVYEQFMMVARMEEPVRQRLGCDVIELENPSETWGLKNRDWKSWTTEAGNKVLMPGDFDPVVDEKGYIHILDFQGKPLAYMPKGGLYFERACVTTMSDKIKKMAPEIWKQSIPLYTDEDLRILEQNARYFYENTEYSISGGFLKGGLGTNGIFAGHTITDWLCVLISEREYAYSILQATAEKIRENLALYLQAVGKYIDTILVSGTDYGTQTAPLFNPEIFRELHVPNMKMINDYIHKHSNAKTMYHSCGAVFDLIEHFIAAGVDIINPIQTTAAKMNPHRLKECFGGKIVFWGGGVDTQVVMPNGTVEDVRDQVRERINIFASGGGFIFAATHNIQHDVPPENIVAMADAVAESGCY